MADERIEILGRVPLFDGLPERELAAVANAAKERRYDTGDVIVGEGEGSIGFFVIAEGTARVEARGERRGTLGPGASFWRGGFTDENMRVGGRRTASVIAESPVRSSSASPRQTKRPGPASSGALRAPRRERCPPRSQRIRCRPRPRPRSRHPCRSGAPSLRWPPPRAPAPVGRRRAVLVPGSRCTLQVHATPLFAGGAHSTADWTPGSKGLRRGVILGSREPYIRVGLRSATGNRVTGDSSFAGSNPALSAARRARGRVKVAGPGRRPGRGWNAEVGDAGAGHRRYRRYPGVTSP